MVASNRPLKWASSEFNHETSFILQMWPLAVDAAETFHAGLVSLVKSDVTFIEADEELSLFYYLWKYAFRNILTVQKFPRSRNPSQGFSISNIFYCVMCSNWVFVDRMISVEGSGPRTRVKNARLEFRVWATVWNGQIWSRVDTAENFSNDKLVKGYEHGQVSVG